MAKTIIGTFEETAKRRGAAAAVRFRKDGGDTWETRSWADMDRERKIIAAGLMAIGVQPKERINVLASTSYQWMLADLAIQTNGAETIPIYQSNLEHEVEYIVNDCGAVMLIVDDKDQYEKLKKIRPSIGGVRRVVVMKEADVGGCKADGGDWVIGWSEVRKLGEEKLAASEATLRERTDSLTADDILVIIYTSGTTGNPKGVMLTHGNLVYETEACKKINLIGEDDLQLLFLPLAHSFAKVLQCLWLAVGHEMAIDADLTRIVPNLAIVKPTVMAAVPRIFEKVYASVVGKGLEGPGIKGKLFKWALGVNDQYAQHMIEGRPIPFGLGLQLSLAKKIVYSKIKATLDERFGGRLRYFISGGAPLPKKMAFFFANAGISILEGYGLTETSAATCVNRMEKNLIGTVGPAVPGTELKIAADGEILIRGPGVMKGYWNRPEATKEAISADGWFSSGDIGIIDQDGYLKITDRKKDIIVTAGGKNVAPQNIENMMKAQSPIISQVMVHGDKRNYLSALVTVEPEATAKFGKEKGIGGDYSNIAQSKEMAAVVQEVVDKVNSQLASYETIKKFKVLPKDFTVGDELTPTLKVKRRICEKKYQSVLDGFYSEKVD